MSDQELNRPSGEEDIDEEGRNPTQQRIDEGGYGSEPATNGEENEPSAHEGEEGQELV